MDNEPKQCCMCIEDLTMENIVTTECDHQFCKDCFWKWIKTKNSCPFCRKSLLKTDEEQKEQEHMRQMLDMRANVVRDIEEGYDERDGIRSSIAQLSCRNTQLTHAKNTMSNICNEKENQAIELQEKIIHRQQSLKNLQQNNVEIAKFVMRLNKKNMLKELKEKCKLHFSLKNVEIRAQHEVAWLYNKDKNSRNCDLPPNSRVRKRLRRQAVQSPGGHDDFDQAFQRPVIYREIVRYMQEIGGSRPSGGVIGEGFDYQRDNLVAPEVVGADRNDITNIESINNYWNAPLPNMITDILGDLIGMG